MGYFDIFAIMFKNNFIFAKKYLKKKIINSKQYFIFVDVKRRGCIYYVQLYDLKVYNVLLCNVPAGL